VNNDEDTKRTPSCQSAVGLYLQEEVFVVGLAKELNLAIYRLLGSLATDATINPLQKAKRRTPRLYGSKVNHCTK